MLLQYGFSLGGFLPFLDEKAGKVTPPTFLGRSPRDDLEAMTWALSMAMTKVGVSSPNPNVGCIIVAANRVIAEGVTQFYGGRHAEREAIATCQAKELLKGATAYITLEPCAHQGKQPPCVTSLIEAGIKKCVIGCEDLHPLVQGQGMALLKAAGIEVVTSPLKTECQAYHLPFFYHTKTQRPLFIGKWAQTINGFLADDANSSQWITGSAARRYTHFLRSKYDAIMVGAKTVISDQPTLDARSSPWHKRNPVKIIFDPKGEIPSLKDSLLQSRLLAKTFSDTSRVVYFGPEVPIDLAWFKARNEKLFTIDSTLQSMNQSPIEKLVQDLIGNEFVSWNKAPLQSILVEGGAKLLNMMIAQQTLDAFQIFINPAFISGHRHQIGKQSKIDSLATIQRYGTISSYAFGDDILLEFLPQKTLDLIF